MNLSYGVTHNKVPYNHAILIRHAHQYLAVVSAFSCFVLRRLNRCCQITVLEIFSVSVYHRSDIGSRRS